MIAAIANFMNYDVHDLELTTVQDNKELGSLLTTVQNNKELSHKGHDCSLDLTSQCEKKREKDENEEETDPIKKMVEKEDETKQSKKADVAENLMLKSHEDDAETCLKNLIEALKEAKDEARRKAEKEALLKT